MKMYLLPLLLAVTVLGCNREPGDTLYFKATVSATHDISCGIPVLNFSEDSTRIRRFTGRKDVIYTVLNLPDSFAIQNKKLYVQVALLQPSEAFPCNTLGIAYTHLKIVAAKGRE